MSVVENANGQRLSSGADGDAHPRSYGLVWNRALETGGVLVGDAVDLVLDVAAIWAG
jgi:hypothetical protein